MRQKMKELLHEFEERDFTAFKMWDVLYALMDIENHMRILRIHRKHGELAYAAVDKSNLKIDFYEAQRKLNYHGLDYDAKDLVDDEVLKELEDEL